MSWKCATTLVAADIGRVNFYTATTSVAIWIQRVNFSLNMNDCYQSGSNRHPESQLGHTGCVPHTCTPSYSSNASFNSSSPSWSCMMREIDLRDSLYSLWRYLFCLLVPGGYHTSFEREDKELSVNPNCLHITLHISFF